MPPFLPSPHVLDHSALGAPVGLKSQSPSSSADFLRIVHSAKRQGETIVAPPCGLPAIGLPKVEEATYGRTTMNDNKLEDIAWRLIAEAKVERNPNRRRRLMREAFELVRCAGALRGMDAERDANFAPHALVGSAYQKPLGKV